MFFQKQFGAILPKPTTPKRMADSKNVKKPRSSFHLSPVVIQDAQGHLRASGVAVPRELCRVSLAQHVESSGSNRL
jgi:hypothetical protein